MKDRKSAFDKKIRKIDEPSSLSTLSHYLLVLLAKARAPLRAAIVNVPACRH
jgi:hypothetical protein